MAKARIVSVVVVLLAFLIGFGVVWSEQQHASFNFYRPFKLGLDLKGGTRLVYQADVSKIPAADLSGAMDSLKQVIDRRVNVFGVAEPVIQVEQTGLGAAAAHRLVVEMPGFTDTKQAADYLSKTPQLEFMIARPDGPEKDAIVKAIQVAQAEVKAGKAITDNPLLHENPDFIPTGLSGQYLTHATVEFSQQSLTPLVSLQFNAKGTELFDQITKANIGKPVAIFLDNQEVSQPVVQEEISTGQAQISGNFTVTEAKSLAQDLNLGALPVPITLVSTETVGATLGADALNKGVKAGLLGFMIIGIFMILWYRLPGFVATVSLGVYLVLMLALFKLIPITITAAGIAGLILSLGIAVDANVLIFERLKDERRHGKGIEEAIKDGFERAWSSIRDSNLSTIISSIILFWFGSSLIKGFALNLAVGVLVSLLTAITITRNFLLSLDLNDKDKLNKFLFGSGIHK